MNNTNLCASCKAKQMYKLSQSYIDSCMKSEAKLEHCSGCGKLKNILPPEAWELMNLKGSK